jgi:formylglycine-generating enzyme required for sulfatase activity
MQQRGLTTDAGSANAGAVKYYALVIGNNAYTALPKLKTAEADAREIERLLRESYGFETKLLVNATRAQIVAALSSYRRELTPDANLLIYYAGHGYNDKDADKAYWLPVDATRDDVSNWIIADEITTGIRVIPAKHVLVISDSCYSGTLTRGLGAEMPHPTEREQFLQRMAAGHSRTLMASGGDEPVADSGGGGHSVFAAALMRGLSEIDKTQFTAAELFNNYVVEAVAGRAEQTPVYDPLRNSGHESGDFIFTRVKTGNKTVEVTVKAPPPAPVDPSVFELEYWNAIKDSSDPEEYRGYLTKYPNGQFADIARRRAAGGRGGNGTASVPIVDPTPGPSASPATGGGTVANTTTAARPPASMAAGMPALPVGLAPTALRSFDYVTVTLDRSGALKNRSTQSNNYYTEDLGGAQLEMVAIPGGTFLMGSSDADVQAAFAIVKQYRNDAKLNWFIDEMPQHQVSVRGFYMGKNEVTQAQWRAIMGTNPSNFKGDALPVEQVSWNDAVEFCKKLSAKTGREYRLPTEAEWEYAARAGTTTPFAFGETITPEIVNYRGEYPYGSAPKGTNRGKTMPVGSTGAANGFGLFDMHGNVWEWVQDYGHENYGGLLGSAPTDGSAWLSGGDITKRIIRGGSWGNDAYGCLSAGRGRSAPDDHIKYIGLRVVAVARQ